MKRRVWITLIVIPIIALAFFFLRSNISIIKSILAKNEKVLLSLVAGMFENFPSLIRIGILIDSYKSFTFWYYVILSTVFASITDITIFIALKFILKSVAKKMTNSEKAASLLHNIEKYETIVVFFYRFVPFGRIPTIAATTIVVQTRYFIISNIIGAFLWSIVHIFLGCHYELRTFFGSLVSQIILLLPILIVHASYITLIKKSFDILFKPTILSVYETVKKALFDLFYSIRFNLLPIFAITLNFFRNAF